MFFHFGAVDVDPHQQFHLTVKLEFFEKFALTAPQVDHLKGGGRGSIRKNEVTTYKACHSKKKSYASLLIFVRPVEYVARVFTASNRF